MTDRLTPDLFDDIAAPRVRRSSLSREALWGAQAIADFIGTSDDYVRKLARQGMAPIRMRGGRYFSTRTEITAWLMPGIEERK